MNVKLYSIFEPWWGFGPNEIIYSVKRAQIFDREFADPSICQKVLFSINYLLKIAIIVFFIVKDDPFSLGALVIEIVWSQLCCFIGLSTSISEGIGINFKFSLIRFYLRQTILLIDFDFFLKECQTYPINKQRDGENYIYSSSIQWFQLKRISIAARIHFITYYYYYYSSSSDINWFTYIMFIESIVQLLYYNYQYTKILVVSEDKNQELLSCLISNLELIVQFIQSILMVLYFGTSEPARTSIIIIVSIVSLFTLICNNCCFFYADPFVIGLVEYIVLGSQLCFLIPILKNDYAMTRVYLNRIINILFYGMFIILQLIIQSFILTFSKHDMPSGCVQLQIVLIVLLYPIMFIKLYKIRFFLFFKEKPVEINSTFNLSLKQFENKPLTSFKYRDNLLLSLEEIHHFKQLMKQMMISQYFITFARPHFDLNILRGYTYMRIFSISSAEEEEVIEVLYLSLLKSQKTVTLYIHSILFEERHLIGLFFSILKSMVEQNRAHQTINKEELIYYLQKNDNYLDQNKEILNQVINYPQKCFLEYKAYMKNISNIILNHSSQVYYDLYEDLE